MILCRAEAVFASSISKFGKSFPPTVARISNSSKESNYSIRWKIRTATCVLNHIFNTQNDCGQGKLSNCKSDICCLCCPTMWLCGNFTGIKRICSQRFCRKCRHWNCAMIQSVFTCVNSLRPAGFRDCFSVSLHVVKIEFFEDMLSRVSLLQRCISFANVEIDFPKRFPVLQIDSMCQAVIFCRE